MQVWDGLCQGRKALHEARAPGHKEYIALVTQIQEIQRYIVSTVSNLDIMPNLEEMLNQAAVQMTELDTNIKAVTPPKDLNDVIGTLTTLVKETDCRQDLSTLKKQFEILKREAKTVSISADAAKEAAKTAIQAMDNRYRNQLAQTEAAHTQEMQEVKAELDRLNHLLTIKDALTKV